MRRFRLEWKSGHIEYVIGSTLAIAFFERGYGVDDFSRLLRWEEADAQSI